MTATTERPSMAGRSSLALALGLLLTLGASPRSAATPGHDCAAVEGIDGVIGPGRVMLLGEIHGTREGPQFLGTVACHALTRDLDVVLALELPHGEEAAVQELLRMEEAGGVASQIVRLPFWAKDYQDGRTSEAMLALIEQARAWKQAGQAVEIALIDDPKGNRDRFMAQRLLEEFAAAPARFIVALTGNLHNRTAAGSGRMGERVTSTLGRERVVSLNMSHAGGSAWICEATQGCGPLSLRQRAAEPAGRVRLYEATDSRGYDGTYGVGTLTASAPARDRFPAVQE